MLNPLNAKETENLIAVSRLVSKLNDDPALKEIPDKKFYLAMDFYDVDDFRMEDPPVLGHMFTPQINHISNMLPPSPVLSQFKDIPKVRDSSTTDREFHLV